jgi:hypothetical protein
VYQGRAGEPGAGTNRNGHRTRARPDGKLIRGPMLFLQTGWSALEDADLHAVAAFVKTLPPVKNKVPDAPAPKAAAAAAPAQPGTPEGAR